MVLGKRCIAVVVAGLLVSLVAAAADEKVKQVDSKYVCMITKKHFKTEQMQVKVEGRTYYACCDMCKTQLADDPSTRSDVDPVSGNKVDKATAVVGVDKTGNVYFFENVQNLERYRVPAKK